MMRAERLTARLHGEFELFMIGMRMNRPLYVHRELPVATAMTRTLAPARGPPSAGAGRLIAGA